MHYIRKNVIDSGTPRHERDRILRRSRVYEMKGETLYRRMPNGSICAVPKPEDRVAMIRFVHEQHGHFGVRRTTSLIAPYYWWVGMGKDIAYVVQNCMECDRANTAFNVTAKELQPLPVEGLFYRWGVDLAGPFNPTSTSDDKYIFVAIEHFSKYMVVVPISDKTAATTARVFTEHILCKFGSCAEVITDVGTEFAGEFADLLRQQYIDHRTTSPNHPQADGLAERSVQTVKRSLKKYCESSQQPETWHAAVPWIVFGYNCSVQASTKYSPYHLLFARMPIIPAAQREKFDAPLNLDDPDLAVKNIIERGKIAQEASIIAGNNLLIAQHRDKLRYATIRGGGYLPMLREFQPGDFVYVKRRNLNSALQMSARREIFRVKDVRPNGTVILQGKCGNTIVNNVANCAPCHLPHIDPTIDVTLARPEAFLACEVCRFMDEEDKMLLCDACGTGWHTMCLDPPLTCVPKGDWLCPRCIKDGVTLEDVAALRAASTNATPVQAPVPPALFRDAAARRRSQDQAVYDGRVIAMRAKKGATKLARVMYLGPAAGLKCYQATFEDGTFQQLSATEVKRRLMPAGTMIPGAKGSRPA